MKAKRIPMMAIVAAAILMVPICLSAFQQASAIQDSEKIAFRKLTHDFEKAVINAIGDPDITPGPRELLDAYVQDVNRIFLGGPDTIPELVEQYQQDVLAVFQAPPDPDKQAQHDQVKEFRQLTHTFVKAVIGASAPPDPE